MKHEETTTKHARCVIDTPAWMIARKLKKRRDLPRNVLPTMLPLLGVTFIFCLRRESRDRPFGVPRTGTPMKTSAVRAPMAARRVGTGRRSGSVQNLISSQRCNYFIAMVIATVLRGATISIFSAQ